MDWAEAHHDVFVEDDDGKRLVGGGSPEGVEGISRFHAVVEFFAASHGGDEPLYKTLRWVLFRG